METGAQTPWLWIVLLALLTVGVVVWAAWNRTRFRRAALPGGRTAKAPPDGRQALLRQAFEAKNEALRGQGDMGYAKAFAALAHPAQTLLGIAEALSPESADRMRDLCDDEVIKPMNAALRRLGATLSEEGVSLPPSEAELFLWDGYLREYGQAAPETLRSEIKAARKQAAQAAIYRRNKAALEAMGPPLHALREMRGRGEWDIPGVREVASRLRQALRGSGIEPLFYADLEDRPDLRAGFLPAHPQMPQTPGLFLRDGDALKPYADYAGSAHAERAQG